MAEALPAICVLLGALFGWGLWAAAFVLLELRRDPKRVNPGCGHEDCLGPKVAANRGGCRMGTWADVG